MTPWTPSSASIRSWRDWARPIQIWLWSCGVRRTVEAIHAALDKAVDSEQMKVLIGVVAYTNAFTILRTLDMQIRRMQPQ